MNSYIVTDYGVTPDAEYFQTDKIQSVLDLCRDSGGKVIIPRGNYRVSSLRLWSDTTLYLSSGARLEASEVCEDYEVYPIPDGMELHTDMEMITQYYENRPWPEYRRAIISVYGGRNISIIGEPDSHIDGMNCAGPHGEEGYRGPHGIFMTNVDGVRLIGYSIENCGNFMHQIDTCRNITMRNVSCVGGSDGVHLHCCSDILIEDCRFITGDDCIAGINMENLTVRGCELNTSCDLFRAGGSHILIENCHMWGPGIYPHRMTIVPDRHTDSVRDRSRDLAQSAGRHNLESVWIHFASTNHPSPETYHDITIRNCTIDNADRFLNYHADEGTLQSGTHLCEMTLENVTFTNLKYTSSVAASPTEPLRVTLRNVSAKSDDPASAVSLFKGDDKNTIIDEIPE